MIARVCMSASVILFSAQVFAENLWSCNDMFDVRRKTNLNGILLQNHPNSVSTGIAPVLQRPDGSIVRLDLHRYTFEQFWPFVQKQVAVRGPLEADGSMKVFLLEMEVMHEHGDPLPVIPPLPEDVIQAQAVKRSLHEKFSGPQLGGSMVRHCRRDTGLLVRSGIQMADTVACVELYMYTLGSVSAVQSLLTDGKLNGVWVHATLAPAFINDEEKQPVVSRPEAERIRAALQVELASVKDVYFIAIRRSRDGDHSVRVFSNTAEGKTQAQELLANFDTYRVRVNVVVSWSGPAISPGDPSVLPKPPEN